MLPPDGSWNGIVLHLYRQIDGSVYPADCLTTRNGDKETTYAAFGNFDRLCFSPVPRFIDFLKNSGSAYQWIGGRKDIMMYPLNDPNSIDRHFSFGELEKGHRQPPLKMSDVNGNTERRFLIVTMLYVSDKVKAMIKSYSNLLERCQQKIQSIVAQYNQNLEKLPGKRAILVDVFGTFNSAEIGILWGADQFVDVQFLVDQIRYLALCVDSDSKSEQLFTSSYTIVACFDNTAENWQIDEIRGGALIQIASGTSRDTSKIPSKSASMNYLEQLKNEVLSSHPDAGFDIACCAGEFDYILDTRPPQLQLLSKIGNNKYGGLHVKNQDFTSHFSTSTTRLFYNEEKDIDLTIREYDWKSHLIINFTIGEIVEISQNWKLPREIISADKAYYDYKQRLLKSVSEASSFCTNLDLLYGDFIRTVNTTPDRQWAKDLSTQMNTALQMLTDFRDPQNTEKIHVDRDYIEQAESVFQLLRQQIHHVTEAGKFSFEEPCLHAESTSEYDLLFHMYYGAVKDILSCMYDRTNGETQAKQSTLVPLIQFQPTPIIKSSLYFDKKGIDQRLVDITIPYDAWGEPDLFVMYLVHELYHYAAPFNRSARNDYFAKFIVTELIVNSIETMLHVLYETDADSEISLIEQDDYDRAIPRMSSYLRNEILNVVSESDILQHIILNCQLEKTDLDLNESESTNNTDNWMDLSWVEFYHRLTDWYMGKPEYNNSPDNFGGFLVDTFTKTFSALDKIYTSNYVEEYERTLYRHLKWQLSEEEASPGCSSLVFVDYVQELSEKWNPVLIAQLRELFPDYAMVKLSGLSTSEYLFLFAILQEKLHNANAVESDTALPVRIGYIVNLLLGSNTTSAEERVRAFQNTKSDFTKLYCAYCMNCCWKDVELRQRNVALSECCQKAKKWISVFTGMLTDYYSQYGCYQAMFDEMTKSMFDPLCQSENKGRIRSNTQAFFNALREESQKKLFDSSLASIWLFQPQPFLEELTVSDAKPELASTSVKAYKILLNNKRTDTLRLLNEAEYLQKELLAVSKKLEKTHRNVFGAPLPRHGLWYRGTQNSSYDILPSAIVHFLDDDNLRVNNSVQGLNAEGTLYQYQRSLIERFKYQADGASEFVNGMTYTMPDYLAIMQHYQKYTCFLDWSEDAFSSLFFALEHYVEKEESQMDESTRKADAAIYVLDPMLFNRARKKMVKTHLKKMPLKCLLSTQDAWVNEQNLALDRERDGYIPNLSAKGTTERFGMFSMDIPAKIWEQSCKSNPYLESKCLAKDAKTSDAAEEIVNLPIAVHTSRLNPRIRTQSGQFIAYSPFVMPMYGPGEDSMDKPGKKIRAYRFSYLSLSKIQQYYLEEFPDESPFMYEIRLASDIKEGVAEFLRKAGINRYRIYPELTHLKL